MGGGGHHNGCARAAGQGRKRRGESGKKRIRLAKTHFTKRQTTTKTNIRLVFSACLGRKAYLYIFMYQRTATSNLKVKEQLVVLE